MLRIIDSIMISLFLALTLSVSYAGVVAAQGIEQSVCQGSDLTLANARRDECHRSTSGSTGRLNSLIAQIINIISVIVGIVAVIMIIYGGFRFITSGGDSGNVSAAKNTILYAIIGLIIVALAQFIVKFVLAKSTGVG